MTEEISLYTNLFNGIQGLLPEDVMLYARLYARTQENGGCHKEYLKFLVTNAKRQAEMTRNCDIFEEPAIRLLREDPGRNLVLV